MCFSFLHFWKKFTRQYQFGKVLDLVAQIGLSQVFGPDKIRIERMPKVGPCGSAWPWPRKIFLYDTTFTNFSCQELTIGHELAHHWNFKVNLSEPFEKYVGASTWLLGLLYDPGPESPPIYGGNPPPNRTEDFAESFNDWTFEK
jgi:hypothetical protein